MSRIRLDITKLMSELNYRSEVNIQNEAWRIGRKIRNR